MFVPSGNHTRALSFHHRKRAKPSRPFRLPAAVCRGDSAPHGIGARGEAIVDRMSKKVMKNVGSKRAPRSQPTPDWTSGLRRLYDAVVEEPLPDSFAQLLDKLDDADD
jgi:hypothetical protein